MIVIIFLENISETMYKVYSHNLDLKNFSEKLNNSLSFRLLYPALNWQAEVIDIACEVLLNLKSVKKHVVRRTVSCQEGQTVYINAHNSKCLLDPIVQLDAYPLQRLLSNLETRETC